MSAIPERSWPLLEGLKVFVIDALRPDAPHPAHFSLEQALRSDRPSEARGRRT